MVIYSLQKSGAKQTAGRKWCIPNKWYTVSGDLLHQRNLQQTLPHFLNNHQSKDTHRLRQHLHRHPKLTIQDQLVMPGWADGPTKIRLRSAWDNYELNDQIPNTETKKKKRTWTAKQNGTALVTRREKKPIPNTCLNTPSTKNPRDYMTTRTCTDSKRTEYKYMLNFVSHILCYLPYRRNNKINNNNNNK